MGGPTPPDPCRASGRRGGLTGVPAACDAVRAGWTRRQLRLAPRFVVLRRVAPPVLADRLLVDRLPDAAPLDARLVVLRAVDERPVVVLDEDFRVELRLPARAEGVALASCF
jgi:hypothetical protein